MGLININGTDYDLQSIKHRSIVLQLIKDAMEDVEEEDVIVAEGDFKISG